MQPEMNKRELIEIYKKMCLIRNFENTLNELYMSGRLVGDLHLYVGEEAVAVGVCASLRKDDYIVSTALTSSTTVGTVAVTVRSESMKETRTEVVFAEKPRYCMHCGAKISYADRRCPKCGKAPPAGVDTKLCKNCNSVIPIIAKFCSECGASQPE